MLKIVWETHRGKRSGKERKKQCVLTSCITMNMHLILLIIVSQVDNIISYRWNLAGSKSLEIK